MFGRIVEIQDPKGKLKAFIEIALSKELLESNHHRVFLSMLMQPTIFDRSQALLKQVFEQFITMLVTMLDEAGFSDPQTEAWLIYAMLDGIMLHYWFQQDNYPLDDVRKHILKRYNLDEIVK